MTTTFSVRVPSQTRLRELVESIDHAALPAVPADLLPYARKETFREEFGCERRRDRRYSLITDVVVAPVDGQCRPAGKPFVALSSGMSVSGIRLLHTCPATSEFLFLQVGRDAVKYLLSVLRSRPVGNCFEIAGQLVKLDGHEPIRSRCPLIRAADPVIVSGAQSGLESTLTPTAEELAQWAAVTAAIETLKSRNWAAVVRSRSDLTSRWR